MNDTDPLRGFITLVTNKQDKANEQIRLDIGHAQGSLRGGLESFKSQI